MSGRMCVTFAEKDINFILQVQNFGNFNQISHNLYPRNSFPDPVLWLKCIFRSNEKIIIIFVSSKIYGMVHIEHTEICMLHILALILYPIWDLCSI